MTPELKAEWVAALRSGQYKQTTGMLKACDGSGFCCLGVLADIMPNAEWSSQFYLGQQSVSCLFNVNGEVIDQDEDLPYDLAASLGLHKTVNVADPRPEYANEDKYDADLMIHLMNLNDQGKWDFNKIADFIEENL